MTNCKRLLIAIVCVVTIVSAIAVYRHQQINSCYSHRLTLDAWNGEGELRALIVKTQKECQAWTQWT